jgi:hypothetical protein
MTVSSFSFTIKYVVSLFYVQRAKLGSTGPNQGVSCQTVTGVAKKGKHSICSSYSSFTALLKNSKLDHIESRYQWNNHAVKTDNCNATRRFKVAVEHFRLWMQPQEKLLNVNKYSTMLQWTQVCPFRGTRTRDCWVCVLRRNNGVQITYEVIRYKVQNVLNQTSHGIISNLEQVSMYVWIRGTSSLSTKEFCFVRSETKGTFG